MMLQEEKNIIIVEHKRLKSLHLKRDVIIDCYLPENITDPSGLSLLIINDGQDLPKMNFTRLINELNSTKQLFPVLFIGVYAGEERMMEYGAAGVPDFKGRGAAAQSYQNFLLNELIPFLQKEYNIEGFKMKAIAGFSLGGLSAIDTIWSYPETFSIAGIFSGSLWWRSKDLNEGYDEATHRIMHKKIREGIYTPGLKFYFATGSLDETADRNGNGIIDSIDDTLDLIEELKKIGYSGSDINYVNDYKGKHDVETWGRAMPCFLLWGWGRK